MGCNRESRFPLITEATPRTPAEAEIDITEQHEEMFPVSYDINSNLRTIKNVRHIIVHSFQKISLQQISPAQNSL